MDRKVLLVGGAGYIGTVMTNHLLSSGWDVRCMDQLIYKNQSCVWPFIGHPKYEFIRSDLRSSEAFKVALDGITDVVILAGLVGDPITKKFPEASNQINFVGMSHFLDAAAASHLDRLIFVSTCSNYGLVEKDVAVDEDYPLAPLSLYAEHKVEIEKKILSLKGQVGFHPTILRFATAFGFSPRMRFDLTVNEFVRDLYLEKELLVFDAQTWRPYCHVKDFARATEKVLQAKSNQVSFEVFNVGKEENNYTKQMIVDEIKKSLPLSVVKFQERGSDPRNYRVNFSKIRKTLDFAPLYSVPNGIGEILDQLKVGLLDNVDEQKHFFGNYEIFL